MATDTRTGPTPHKARAGHARTAPPAPVDEPVDGRDPAPAVAPVQRPPRIRRSVAARRVRRAADLAATIEIRDRLRRLADRIAAGAGNPQRAQFVEAAIGESLDAASGAAADRWLACEAATWALGWMARRRRAGGSAGGLLERLVREAAAATARLAQGDTQPARFVLVLARLFGDVEACRRLEEPAATALVAEIERLVSPRGVVNVAGSDAMVERVVRWTACREVAEATSVPIWGEATERRWREAATGALRLLGDHGRWLAGGGLMPGRFTAPLVTAVTALGGRRRRTAVALRQGRRDSKPRQVIRRDLHDAAAAVSVLRSGWTTAALRILIDYRQPTPHLEIAAGDRLLACGPWRWQIEADGQPLESEGPWTVSCWESDRKASVLEISTPLTGGLQLDRQVVLLPRDRIVLLADALTVSPAGRPPASGLRYRGVVPVAPAVDLQPADETRELLAFDTRVRFVALPLALPEWRGTGHGSLAAGDGGLVLAQETAAHRCYAPLWLDFDARRAGRPLTWRQLTVADSRRNLGPHQAAGFRIQAGTDQWLLYRALDAPRNRTLLGCNVSGEFLLGRVRPRGSVSRTIEIQ